MTFYVRNPDSKITRVEVFWDKLSDRMRLVTLSFAALALLLIGYCMLQAGVSVTLFAAQAWPVQFSAIAPWSPWVFALATAWNYAQTYYRAPSLPSLPLILTMAISGLVMYVHYV